MLSFLGIISSVHVISTLLSAATAQSLLCGTLGYHNENVSYYMGNFFYNALSSFTLCAAFCVQDDRCQGFRYSYWDDADTQYCEFFDEDISVNFTTDNTSPYYYYDAGCAFPPFENPVTVISTLISSVTSTATRLLTLTTAQTITLISTQTISGQIQTLPAQTNTVYSTVTQTLPTRTLTVTANLTATKTLVATRYLNLPASTITATATRSLFATSYVSLPASTVTTTATATLPARTSTISYTTTSTIPVRTSTVIWVVTRTLPAKTSTFVYTVTQLQISTISTTLTTTHTSTAASATNHVVLSPLAVMPTLTATRTIFYGVTATVTASITATPATVTRVVTVTEFRTVTAAVGVRGIAATRTGERAV